MKTLMERFQLEQDKLDQEQEDSHGDYKKMKVVLKKKIRLYKQLLKEDDLTDLERVRMENKKDWIMSHMLSLIIDEKTTNKISELTKRVDRLEKKTAGRGRY